MKTMTDLCENGERVGEAIAEMTYLELSSLCDVVFRKNPEIAEWIARDLEIRAMDKVFGTVNQ